jgi:hypothetical protein
MSLAAEYFWLVFFAALGFIQVAAAQSRLKGLLLTQKPVLNRVVAGILITPGAIIFFTWNYRNPVGIIEGSQQAGLFSLAALASIGVTVILGSILNHFQLKPSVPPVGSIEDLKDRTFFQAILARLNCRR